MTATVYEEFHKGSINFAKMVYEKLAQQETNLEISKKYSDDLCITIQAALEGMHKITDELNKEQRSEERRVGKEC